MNKVKLLLLFPKQLTGEPITYNLVKNYDLKINILKAQINYNIEGRLLIELEGTEKNIKSGIAYLKSQNIKVKKDGTSTYIDFDKCIGCGACVAACEVGALYMNEENKLVFDTEKCLECMLCVKACPQRIIKNIFN
ncbi:MAG: NIL domain-containing protein [Anaerofustis sp.]